MSPKARNQWDGQQLDPRLRYQRRPGLEEAAGQSIIDLFLFTKLLTWALVSTAESEASGTVRVVYISSIGTELVGDKDIVAGMDYLDWHICKPAPVRCGYSKTGNWLHGVNFAVSVALNPGNLASELYYEVTGLRRKSSLLRSRFALK